MKRRTLMAVIGGGLAAALLVVILIVGAPAQRSSPAARSTRAPTSSQTFAAPPTGASNPAPAPALASPRCGSYPRPGTTVAGATPADLSDEYGVLRAARRTPDRLAPRWLRSLPVSGIVASGVRFVGRTTYGRVYVVAARHQLAFPLVPDRCVPRAKRAAERSLERQLRLGYAHEALCLVIVAGAQESPICGSAPGTVDPLVYVRGTPGFGMVPNGVAAVRVQFRGSPAVLVAVRRNLWLVNDSHVFIAPCGVQWLDATGTVLRTIQSCTRDST